MPLRDVTEEDLISLYEYQREPAGSRMAGLAPRDRDAFWTHWRTRILANPYSVKQVIVSDGVVTGHLVSWDHDGKRLVGYWLGERYWGRGLATTALHEFVRLHERTRPLSAWVTVQNVGSMRVLEKCGFRAVGGPVAGEDGVAEQLMELDGPPPP